MSNVTPEQVAQPDQTATPTPPRPVVPSPGTPQLNVTNPLDPEKLIAATNAAPTLTPDAVVGVASAAPDSQTAGANAAVASAYRRAMVMSDILSGLPTDFQHNFWSRESDSMQGLLTAAGYTPPNAQDVSPKGTGGGFWHDVLHGAVGSLDAVRHFGAKVGAGAVTTFVKEPSKAFSAAMSPFDQLTRAALKNSQQGNINSAEKGESLWNLGNILHTLNPVDILHDWGSVSNGATSFQPEAILYVKKQMGITGQTLKLAKTIAGGVDLQSALASVPADERANAYALINSNPKFMDAVKMLSDSHLSLGQATFGGISPEQFKQMFPGQDLSSLEGTALAGQATAIVGSAAAIAHGGAGDSIFADGAVSALGTLRGASAATLLGAGATASVGAALEGKTVDAATQIHPFGITVNPMSGILDGLVSWYGNPLFQGMQGAGALRSARNTITLVDGMGTGENTIRFYTSSPDGTRFADRFMQLVTQPLEDTRATSPMLGKTYGVDAPNFAALDQGGIPTAGMEDVIRANWTKLRDAKATGDAQTMRQAVGEMIAEPQALTNIFRGREGGLLHDDVQYPHLTLEKDLLEKIKGIGQRALSGTRVDIDKLSPRALVEGFGSQQADDDFAAAVESQKNLGPAARFARRFVSLIPSEPYIRYSDAEKAVKAERFAAFSLPKTMAQMVRNGISAIDPSDHGAIFDFMKGVTQDVFHDAHVYDTPDGAAWANDWVGRQKYGVPEGAAYRDANGVITQEAVLETELADAVGLPPFRELLQFSKKTWMMHTLENGIDAGWIDKFMSRWWKPLLLLRTGFAFRFAGEEVLNFALRHSFSDYVQSRIASSLEGSANVEAEQIRQRIETELERQGIDSLDIAGMNKRDGKNLLRSLLSGVPDEVANAIRSRQELQAAVQSWDTLSWARRLGMAVVPEHILEGARELATRGVLDTAYDDYINAISGTGEVYLNDFPKDTNTDALVRSAEGAPLTITTTGNMKQLPKDTEDAVKGWMFELGNGADSSLFRATARGWDNDGEAGMKQGALDWIIGKRQHEVLARAAEGNNEDELALAESSLRKHEELTKRFAVNFKTADGRTLATGAAQPEEVVNDWASAVVAKAKRLLFTGESQDTTLVDGEEVPNETSGLQPIRLQSTTLPREPFKIESGDADRAIEPTEEDDPYHRLAKTDIRLFHARNNKTAQPIASDIANPARDWTPSFQEALNRAGEDGSVYHVDVPKEQVASRYTFRPRADNPRDIVHDYLDEIDEAQHRRRPGSPSSVRGSFESGDIAYGNRGEPVPNTILSQVARGIVPSASELNRVDKIHWPDHVLYPEMTAKFDGTKGIQGIIQKGMRGAVGRPANWLSRQPIFTYNYATALRQARDLVESLGLKDVDGSLAHDIAFERATHETIPYIHNPGTKSQFDVVVRNIMPFWFAQEQFYKRWGRLFGTYPEAWYKLQQTVNGLKSVGFIQKDQYGEDSFVYPGSQAALWLLTRFPFNGSLPISVGLTGEINQLNPTLTTGGAPIPALGPIITVPMSVASVLFPKLDNVAQSMLGPDAPSMTEGGDQWDQIIDQLIPSAANRLEQWMSSPSGGTTKNPNAAANNIGSPLFMSTLIQAAQILETNGDGLTNEQSGQPRLVQQYIDKLVNYTRNLILIRTFFGLLAPATPTYKFNDKGLGSQLSALEAVMPYDAAVAAFFKAHPNATPMEIFDTTSSGLTGSGAYVPPTQHAAKFINENITTFENYTQLAPWLIPAPDQKGLFNSNAYEEETSLDLRARRNLNSWYDEVKYSEGANVYFPLDDAVTAAKAGTLTKDQEDALIGAGFSGGDKTALQQWWDKWKTNFNSTHPLFASQLTQEGVVAQSRRNSIVTELNDAIKNGAMPHTTLSKDIETMMYGANQVAEYYKATEGNDSYETQHKDNKDAFIAWGNAYVKANPAAAPFWAGVLKSWVPG